MTIWDSYFSADDKPYAENLNTALLLSNVFDLTVPVELPRMLSFSENTNPRKASVAVVTFLEKSSGVTINSNTISGTGDVKFKWYPNFNQYGGMSKIEWTATGTVTCDVKDANGATMVSGHTGGVISGADTGLQDLQEFTIILHLTSASLSMFKVTMVNNQQTRYGATVGITDVTGLDDRLDSIEDSEDTIRNIKLVSSSYNPTIDSGITVTATVTDINNDPVEGEDVTLQLNGSDLTTETTTSQGIAMWSVTCSNWGLQDLRVGNTSIQVNVGGWREDSGTNYDINYNKDFVEFRFHHEHSMTVPTSWQDYGTVFGINTKPASNVQFMEQFGSVIIRVKTDGVVQCRSIKGSSVSVNSLVAYALWRRG